MQADKTSFEHMF